MIQVKEKTHESCGDIEANRQKYTEMPNAFHKPREFNDVNNAELYYIKMNNFRTETSREKNTFISKRK